MPAPPETMRTSAVQCRGGFRKKFPDPPSSEGRKGGLCAVESKTLFPKISSPVVPRRFGPSQESDTGALSIATSHIDATAACMDGMRRKRCSRRGVLRAERMATRIGGGAGGT